MSDEKPTDSTLQPEPQAENRNSEQEETWRCPYCGNETSTHAPADTHGFDCPYVGQIDKR